MTRLQKILLSFKSAELKAVRRVTQGNTGKKTAGIDGVKRISIAKNGKQNRPLGTPTIEDRVKQYLVLLVLESQWEANFEANSYGFRPGKSCHGAIEAIFIAINQKLKYVLNVEIQSCFNEINHNALVVKLLTSPLMKKQIRAWLKAGLLENEVENSTDKGTPQDRLISLLLMSIILHGMENGIIDYIKTFKTKGSDEKYFIKRRRSSSVSTIQHADDFVILPENELFLKSCTAFIESFLLDLGLKLNDDKTQIRHTLFSYENKKPGFDFLGFYIRQYPIGKYTIRRTNAALSFRTLIQPSKAKIQKHFETMKKVTINTRQTEMLLMELNPKIIGWAIYYRTVVSYKSFKWLNRLLSRALLRWQYKKHLTRSCKWLNSCYYYEKVRRK